jgi:hypothetical protein
MIDATPVAPANRIVIEYQAEFRAKIAHGLMTLVLNTGVRACLTRQKTPDRVMTQADLRAKIAHDLWTPVCNTGVKYMLDSAEDPQNTLDRSTRRNSGQSSHKTLGRQCVTLASGTSLTRQRPPTDHNRQQQVDLRAKIAHDLKTPVCTVCTTGVRYMLDSAEDPRQKNHTGGTPGKDRT